MPRQKPVTVSELFRVAKLKPSVAVRWEDIPFIKEKSCGIYVVAITGNPKSTCRKANISGLTKEEKELWLHFQPIIYIGRTKRALRTRLKEFYRHNYGDKSPHRGGQSRSLVSHIPQWVFFAATNRFEEAENTMIRTFEKFAGKIPYANRRH